MNTLQSSSKTLLFISSLILGGIVWFLTFAQGWNTKSWTEIVRFVLLFGVGGAFIISVIISLIQPRVSIFWSIGFALPMFGWGLLCALLAPLNSIELMWRTFFGVVTILAAFLGAWLGRFLKRL